MANYNHTNDFLGTNTFSPHEFQVELLERARTQNSIICSTSSNFKSFLFVKLAQEFAERDKYKNSRLVVYVLQKENIELVCRLITSLTDLVVSLIDKHSLNNLTKCKEKILSSTVLVTTAPVCSELVENHMIKVCDISLLLFDDGTYEKYVGDIETIMARYSETSSSPRIVALVSGLLGDNFVPDCLNTEIENLERTFRSKWDASCELTNLIRTSHRPNELLISCKQSNSLDLEDTILAITGHLKEFLFDSRYAPDEIYDDELLQEFQNVPNPNAAPLKLVNEFEILLKQYGIWCANQAALQILLITDKLKIKTPYERHFLLLSTLYTQMICVRAHCDNLPVDSLTAIREFSKDKVHRLVEILVDLGPGERPLVERPATPVHVTTTKGSKKMYRGLRRPHPIQSDDSLCVLIFVENVLEAKVLQNLLSTLSQNDPRLRWIIALYIADRTANPQTESKESEVEHRNHEEVLRKFRAHECNILIATKVLEQGYDLPKCNLVIRMQPCSFQSYVHSRARVRSNPSFYLTFVDENKERESLEDYARYLAVEVLLLKHSNFIEASTEEIHQADNICSKYGPYTTNKNESVHLNTAIPLVNRYCAKLPSDTFTKLVPIYNLEWKDDKVRCRLRLPINAPFKITVITAYYDNETLAKRVAAFYMCKALHEYNELDDSLNPISKEHFKPVDDWHDNGDKDEEDVDFDNVDQRPGTTKRRQYYYKRIANALKNCRPLPGQRSYFYKIVMMLTCPIPEEQNTRGRKIYPPEESRQGFGILTSKPLPQICPFPIFTRSGEVQVSLQLINDNYVMEEDMEHKIVEFQNYTFTSVLRLQKYQMVFSPEEAESNYYIVPTVSVNDGSTLIDTTFLCLIYEHRNVLPVTIPDEERNNYKFEATQYEDAVVMPWYRNQDQPQYFYVAEICSNLNPSSSFPGSEYATFDEYYKRKYGIEIQNKEQYLLDVDHTSARLNFLTPRYVNRKGVALPTSSEETKRAKRENLEQKQILVPELCAIHPFPASLWRKAVCLPCILYRMNALLLADEIREMVARDTKLGIIDIPRSFTWEPLNFGWSLCDVLKKNKSSNNLEEIELDRVKTEKKTDIVTIKEICDNEENHNIFEDKPWLEIGTWSNDMVEEAPLKTSVRYGSPTSWLHSAYGYNEYDDFSDSETIYSSEDEEAPENQCGGIQILFQDDYVAEAIETKKSDKKTDLHLSVWGNRQEPTKLHKDKFDKEVAKNVDFLRANSLLTREFTFKKENYVETAVVVNKVGVVFDDECTFICMKTERPLNVSEFQTNLDGGFDFDEDRDLDKHPGPSPSVILQALTMSNANDGINLERLETIGDSFLKYAITDYLYSKYPNTHEGKLSHLRSKQVSNLNLYRLGKKKGLGELMIATKFDPHDNWLPPGYCVSKQLEELLSKAKMPDSALTLADYVATRNMTEEELVLNFQYRASDQVLDLVEPVPYNLVTQHSIPDKSIADCVEALIGAYLIECGPEGALLFMDYLGIRVLPSRDEKRKTPATPHSPFLQSHLIDNQEQKLMRLLEGYSAFEDKLGYSFANKSFLLQALTHASYYPNTVTDCYQRLEFLGDAVLDYLITRHLFEDKRMHSPGALTDLRSALVNNTIFASLAVKFDFHKFFRYLSPGLHQVIEKFIRTQEEVGHKVTEELFLLNFEESDEVEDVEVPKVLGDIFESVAGAIYLDSGQSLNAVWKVYYSMMKSEIEQFSEKVPKSPIRELLELEPETAKFGPAEKLADGRRVRVSVEVFGKGIFKGIGRNYRIAKCTAAKCALKHLKRQCSRFMDF